MPVYRGPDGKIIEERTTRIAKNLGDDTTKPLGHQPPAPSSGGEVPSAKTGSEGSTQVIGKKPAAPENKVKVDEERTMIVGGRRKAPQKAAPEGIAPSADIDAMADPLSGWLVIVDGPGKGHFFRLGYGTNSIGRSQNERVTIDVGDSKISRAGHAVVTYDPRGRNFFVQGGGGTNLTYLEEKVVLSPTELTPFAHISIGETTLQFVPFCGEDFDWQDTEQDQEQDQEQDPEQDTEGSKD